MDTALWQEISAALAGGAASDGTGDALGRLTDLWNRCPPEEAALRCVLAHYAADLEPDLAGEARRHLAKAREHVSQLADDGYGRMIRAGIDGLAQRCDVDTV